MRSEWKTFHDYTRLDPAQFLYSLIPSVIKKLVPLKREETFFVLAELGSVEGKKGIFFILSLFLKAIFFLGTVKPISSGTLPLTIEALPPLDKENNKE